MKKLMLALVFISQLALAEDCIVKTASRDSDGELDSQTIVVCDSRGNIKKNVQVGDLVLEPELGKSPVTKYFTYRNAKCRMFTDRFAVSGELKIYHGVVCQVDNNPEDWIVVSKWKG